MNTLFSVVFCLTIFGSGTPYNILGLFPFPASSHYTMFEVLMKELAKKGHYVDVLNHFPQEKPFPRFHDLNLNGTMIPMRNSMDVTFVRSFFRNRFNRIQFYIEFAGVNFCEQAFNSTAVQELKYTQKTYDLVIAELFGHDCMLAFAHHFKVPVIIIMSTTNMPWGNDRFGNPDNPAYIPTYFVPYVRRMTLVQRLDNALTLFLSKLWYSRAQSRNTAVARKFFENDIPDLEQLVSNTSLLLVNSHYSLTDARPNVPSIVEVGGLHIPPTKPLPKHLQNLLNATSEKKYQGTILFSFGSMVLPESLPREKLVALLEALGELPYQVVWKVAKENLPSDLSVPLNIHVEGWIPQSDVLCHPSTKLFITHCGLLGLQEAIYCGVPCLGIPLFADQHTNMKLIEEQGLALSLDYDTFTKSDVVESALKILNNSSYKENAQKVSERFRDRPLSALDTAVYWVEYVVRHRGAPHLRSSAADLTWYQYYLLDVAAIFVLGCLTICYIICKSIMLLLRKACTWDKTQKLKQG